MEMPDAGGFINVVWPSNRVPHGGIFHTKTADHTTDKQKFLKVLLEESKLTIAQRRKSAFRLREEAQGRAAQRAPPAPLVRPRTSRRRSLSAIRQSGIYDDDLYQPQKRGEDREKMKERLANTMAYGDTPQQQPITVRKCGPSSEKSKLPTSKEKWNELVTQIRERAEWIAEMEYLGRASPHRDIINDQIAERMRALDALGVDSECSTTRSMDSGFSTTRSTEHGIKPPSVRSPSKSIRLSATGCVQDKKSNGKTTKRAKEENVYAYGQFTPLEYSPRRRV